MSGSNRYVAVVGAGLCFGLMVNAAGAQSRIGPSLADAKKALAATQAVAKKLDVGLSCAIVDSRGALVALTRMDNAGYITADVAVGKARASAAFGAPSGGLTRIGELGLGRVIEPPGRTPNPQIKRRDVVPSGSRPDHEGWPVVGRPRLQRCNGAAG